MNSTAVRRIIWKELRAQLSLWLALVIGAFVLQTTLLVTQGTHVQGIGFVVATAFILTACFAVASAGLLFAGEAEDGTREWLQQLPIRPGVLVASKFTFAIVASTLLLGATLGTGLLATAMLTSSPRGFFDADLSAVDVPLDSVAGLFAWGLLFSLRRQRVMSALFAAVVAEIVTVAVINHVVVSAVQPYVAAPQRLDAVRTIAYVSVVALVLIIDGVLALRWARTGAVRARSGATPRRERLRELPGRAGRERMWLELAAWAARRGSPTAREAGVLAWREARSAVPFAVVWLFLGLAATDLGALGIRSQVFAHVRPFQLFYLIATPAVCGLMTCLGDQRQQMFRFLGERGASPARVWWVKQCVWLVAACALTLAFFRWDARSEAAIADGHMQEVSLLAQVMYQVHVPGLEHLARPNFSNRAEDWALRRELVAALLVSLFAAGQCASFWIRRPVLAFGVMLMATPMVVGWHALLIAMDIPLWLASWPLTLALLAATLCSAGAWLRGRDSWTLRFTHLAAVALPAIAVAAFAAAHRAFAVPEPAFAPEIAGELADRVQTFDVFDAEWSRRWRGIVPPFSLSEHYVKGWSIPPEQRPKLRSMLIDLGEDIPQQHGRLDPLVYSPDSKLFVQWIGVFLADPERSVEDGASDETVQPIDEEWRACAAGLRITRYLSEECQSSRHWMECLRARAPLLRRIQTWAARPDQTPERLQHAFDFLVQDLRSPQTMREMVVNRQVYYSQLLELRGRAWAELEQTLRRQRAVDLSNPVVQCAVMPVFERERTRRLLGQVTDQCLSPPSSQLIPLTVESEPLFRWAATTRWLPVNMEETLQFSRFDPAAFGSYSLQGTFVEARTQLAGTAVVVALQRHRLIHGSFPASLREVTPPEDGDVLLDGYTGVPFVYQPEGLPADLYLANGRILGAGQPLLWTPGPGRVHIKVLAQDIVGKFDDRARVIHAGAFVASVIDPNILGRLDVEPADPERIKFFSAGVSGW